MPSHRRLTVALISLDALFSVLAAIDLLWKGKVFLSISVATFGTLVCIVTAAGVQTYLRRRGLSWTGPDGRPTRIRGFRRPVLGLLALGVGLLWLPTLATAYQQRGIDADLRLEAVSFIRPGDSLFNQLDVKVQNYGLEPVFITGALIRVDTLIEVPVDFLPTSYFEPTGIYSVPIGVEPTPYSVRVDLSQSVRGRAPDRILFAFASNDQRFGEALYVGQGAVELLYNQENDTLRTPRFLFNSPRMTFLSSDDYRTWLNFALGREDPQERHASRLAIVTVGDVAESLEGMDFLRSYPVRELQTEVGNWTSIVQAIRDSLAIN